MTARPTTGVDVRPAPIDHKPTLGRLLQLYLHDLSEFDDELTIGPDARFPYPWFDAYWTDPNRHPFTIHRHATLAGFALVRLDTGSTHMAEFGILREHRRAGIGARAARDLFDAFPGPWEVRQVPRNRPAQAFWRRLIHHYTNGAYRESIAADGDIIQHFTAPGPTP